MNSIYFPIFQISKIQKIENLSLFLLSICACVCVCDQIKYKFFWHWTNWTILRSWQMKKANTDRQKKMYDFAFLNYRGLWESRQIDIRYYNGTWMNFLRTFDFPLSWVYIEIRINIHERINISQFQTFLKPKHKHETVEAVVFF